MLEDPNMQACLSPGIITAAVIQFQSTRGLRTYSVIGQLPLVPVGRIILGPLAVQSRNSVKVNQSTKESLSLTLTTDVCIP